MQRYEQIAAFQPLPPKRPPESVDQKIATSMQLLGKIASGAVMAGITEEQYITGEVPRLTEFDIPHLPRGTKLREIPGDMVEEMHRVRNYDIAKWNMPEHFLSRLRVGKQPFQKPQPGISATMDRLTPKNRIVSFANLKIESRQPTAERHSRRSVYQDIVRGYNIMGQGRIPFGLGSMPDVGSVLGYVTAAQSNAMVFVARDKVLSNIDKQVEVVSRVINTLQTVEIPEFMLPNKAQLKEFWKIMEFPPDRYNAGQAMQNYKQKLRDTWIANVGAAIEASENGIERAKRLRDVNCQLLRIYSPEAGLETVRQTEKVHKERELDPEPNLTIVSGQMMHRPTAKDAESVGADGVITGAAGGSQCTTSENAGIPVNTPHLLHDLRGELGIPIGVEGGGVGGHLMEAFALGASFLLKPGEIGRSLEGAGGKYILKAGNKHYMLYGGEAADSSKYWKDSVDELGRADFPEGESGVRELTKDKWHMTSNIRALMHQLSIALVFQRAQNISEVHQRDCSNIAEVSPEVESLGSAYGR